MTATATGSLLGIEGAAARLYFSAFPLMLREDLRLPGGPFTFEGRNRRPPQDAVNCLLSYGYALLVKDLAATTFAVGFDPYLGVYHRPRFGRPALALDLDTSEKILLRQAVGDLINHHEDSIAIVDLGDPGRCGIECFEFMGVVSPLPAMGSQIV